MKRARGKRGALKRRNNEMSSTRPTGPEGGHLVPKERDAFGRNRKEQEAYALPVLHAAFFTLCKGWARPIPLAVLGNAAPPEGTGFIQALMGSAQDPTGIDAWYARRLCQRIEFNLIAWEEHPYRTREDVLQLLRTAIQLAGVIPPEMPLPVNHRRRGGWHVGSGGC